MLSVIGGKILRLKNEAGNCLIMGPHDFLLSRNPSAGMKFVRVLMKDARHGSRIHMLHHWADSDSASVGIMHLESYSGLPKAIVVITMVQKTKGSLPTSR